LLPSFLTYCSILLCSSALSIGNDTKTTANSRFQSRYSVKHFRDRIAALLPFTITAPGLKDGGIALEKAVSPKLSGSNIAPKLSVEKLRRRRALSCLTDYDVRMQVGPSWVGYNIPRQRAGDGQGISPSPGPQRMHIMT